MDIDNEPRANPLTAALHGLARDPALRTAGSKGLSELAQATQAFGDSIAAHEHGVHGDTRDLVDQAREAGGKGAGLERHFGRDNGREI